MSLTDLYEVLLHYKLSRLKSVAQLKVKYKDEE